jgi:hypothetical protein
MYMNLFIYSPDSLWMVRRTRLVTALTIRKKVDTTSTVNRGNPTLGGYTISSPKDIISDQLPKIKTFQKQLGFIGTLSANDAYGEAMLWTL